MIKWIKSYIASEVDRTISTEIKGIDANVSKFISEYRSSIEKMELKHKRNVENHERHMDVVEKYIKEQSVCIENLTKAIEGLSKNER